MAFKLEFVLIVLICQLVSTKSNDISVDTFVSFKNQENSQIRFENVEECQTDCEFYEKCEAFLYYDDFRCFLFYLNKNLSNLNEKIAANKNKNYIYGFKSKVFVNRLENFDLGRQFSHSFNGITLNQCLKKCLLYGNCFGVSFDDNQVCFIYDNNTKNHEMVKGSRHISLVVSHQFEKKELTASTEESIVLEGYELKGPYEGSYAFDAKQCWKFCEKDSRCTASSYFNDFHRASQPIANLFNCYFYNDTFEMVKNKFCTSYVDIKDYSILSTGADKIKALEMLSSSKEINIRKCISKCSKEKKCSALSYDDIYDECSLYSKLSQFSHKKTAPELKPNALYLSKLKILALFDEPCDVNICDTDAGLKCIDDRCRCAASWDYWSGASETCKQCAPGWMSLMNTCWKYFSEELNWDGASRHCSNNYNSSLIVLDNAQKLASYQDIIKQNTEKSSNSKFFKKWVGATKTRPEKFEWIADESEVDLSFSLHGLSRSLNNSGEYCGGFDASVGNKLNDMFCFNKADFICEFECVGFDLAYWAKEKTKDVLNIDKRPRKECRKCKDGSSEWKSYYSSHSEETCYQYFSLPEVGNYFEAQKYCESLDTRLLELRNKFKFDDFQIIFDSERKKRHTKPEHVKAWIGLSAVRPYNFHWGKLEKKINVDSDFWAKNLPDNGDKVCVAFDASESYSLNNFNCYSLNNFFCETTSVHLKCLDGFERYKDSCFTFIHSASMNTWYGAKNYCESKNMTLMTVKDKEKFNAVQSYLKKRSTSETRAWVGAAKIFSDDIKWTLKDGRTSKIDTSMWYKISNPESNRNCAALDGLYENKLNALDCNMKNGFFCEHY